MKKRFLFSMFLAAAFVAGAQNGIKIYKGGVEVASYLSTEVDSVVFVENKAEEVIPDPTPEPEPEPEPAPSPIVTGSVKVLNYGGWFESGYAEWALADGATSYNVYCKGASDDDSKYVKVDDMLVRNYGSYARADVLGLSAGLYSMKIVPVVSGSESGSPTVVSFKAEAHDRDGFAHFNNPEGVGAYNNDGTLKDGAVVLYITEKSKTTVSLDVQTAATKTTSCTGISAILSALQKGYETRPICIRLIGQITADGMTGSGDSNNLLVKASNDSRPVKNVTVEGVGNDATCYGFGVRAIRAHNFEVRNLAVMMFGDDGIAFQDNNKHVWVHHIDFFYGATGSASDQAKGDGSLDLKNDSQYMTLSYNHFWDSGKMSLCGMKSETGPNYISYHHNWFDHSDSRHPRIRTMSVHVYNNYFDGVSKYGVGVTTGGSAFVEANYFRNVSKPMMSSGQGTDAKGEGTFSGENGGIIKSFNNFYTETPATFSFVSHKDNATDFDAYEASSRDEKVPSSFKALKGGSVYDNFDTNSSLMYSCSPDPAEDVAEIVKKESGRMNGGDFTWSFDNAVDDASYDVNKPLKDAISSYKTKLVSVFGE